MYIAFWFVRCDEIYLIFRGESSGEMYVDSLIRCENNEANGLKAIEERHNTEV